jgi:hypothetical protein
LTYNDELPLDSGFKTVSEANISAAKLLQDYVESYEEKINDLLDSYNSENTQIIQAVNSSLKQMSRSLDIIQYKSIDPLVVNGVMESIVTDLKGINNKMKIYLSQEKQLHEDRLSSIQQNYSQIGIKISRVLDNLVSVLSKAMIQKDSLSEKEKELVRSLLIIRTQSDKIKDFTNLSFQSQEEMKAYFQDIISVIQQEILQMKSISS